MQRFGQAFHLCLYDYAIFLRKHLTFPSQETDRQTQRQRERDRERQRERNTHEKHLYKCIEDVPLVEWSLCTLYLLACQVRVTVGDSGLCCCVCVTSLER